MKTGSTIVITFSPTHASKRVAKAVAQGADCNGGCGMREIDLTHTEKCDCRLPADAFAVISAPVYGGHIPPTALERMSGIRADGTPAAIIVTYGNRAHEEALPQLHEFVTAAGFRVIAEGAFIGEHSYCTDEYPIAAGRPDAQDLTAAAVFGQAVRRKLDAGDTSPVDASQLKDRRAPSLSTLRFIRFVLRYRRQQKKHPVVYLPEGDAECCTHCGRCAAICPVGAIPRGDETRTDPARCIRCCACVKGCPVGARTFHTPFAAALARNFARRKEPVTLL